MRIHYAAVKARLEASAALAGKVYNTLARKADGTLITTSYVILYGGTPDVLDDERLSSVQSIDSDAEYIYTVRSVSSTADGALATADVASTQLITAVLVISGRLCNPILLDDGGVVEMDASLSPPLFFLDNAFLLKSSRA